MDVVVENLTKSFGYQKAVRSVSFEVKKGEILGITGLSGSGKSTLLNPIGRKSNKPSVIYPSTIHSTKR
mgnify:CR=1 FL=1